MVGGNSVGHSASVTSRATARRFFSNANCQARAERARQATLQESRVLASIDPTSIDRSHFDNRPPRLDTPPYSPHRNPNKPTLPDDHECALFAVQLDSAHSRLTVPQPRRPAC